MKKSYFLFFLLLGFALLSCEKEVEQKESGKDDVTIGEVRTVTFAASVVDSETKTTLDTSNGNMSWESTDEIVVNGITFSMDKLESGVANFKGEVTTANSYLAGYKLVNANWDSAPNSVTFDFPSSQTYSGNLQGQIPMVSSSLATNIDSQKKIKLKFSHSCAVLRIPLKGDVSIKKIEVSAAYDGSTTPPTGTPLTGKMTATASGNTVGFTGPDHTGETNNIITLTCDPVVPLNSATATDFLIMLPQIASGTVLTVSIFKDGDNTKAFTIANLTATVSSDKGYSLGEMITLSASELKNDVLPGIFAVSSTKAVKFSKGNLQYQASTKRFRFALEQWYHYSEGNGNQSGGGNWNSSTSGDNRRDNQSAWIDLFGFGTSGCTVNSITYKPTLCTEANSDYHNQDQSINGTQYDWGIYNFPDEGWHTLTLAEWQYIFNNYDNGTASVENVHGRVVIPKSFILPTGCSFKKNATNYTTNVYSSTQWHDMEKNGAIFLPYTNVRAGTGQVAIDILNYGRYWTTTQSNISGNTNGAGVYICPDQFNKLASTPKPQGLPVRLVKEIEYGYIDEYGINRGNGIIDGGCVWAPVNCGYAEVGDEINGKILERGYLAGKFYQWGRKDGFGRKYSNGTLVDEDTWGDIYNGRFDSSTMTYSKTTFYASQLDWNIESPDLWGTEGIKNNNPCPKGWTVPTETQMSNLKKEKLTAYGYLGRESGYISETSSARYWTRKQTYWYNSYTASIQSTYSSYGANVRCVKE